MATSSNPMVRACWLAALAVLLFVGGAAIADSWPPPKVETYGSLDGRWRLTTVPRGIRSPLAFFEDKVEGREPAGQSPNGSPEARGKLERVLGRDRRITVWNIKLVNDVAPVRALVSDDGDHVVTFDNWHMVGRGEHVVVIYGEDGRLVRSFTLEEILPDFWIKALPHSVSSTHWGGDHKLDDGVLRLQVVVPQEGGLQEEPTFVDLAIDLETGQMIAPSGRAWDAALAQARSTSAAQIAAEEAWEREFLAPLIGPSSGGEREWHGYLREAFFRIDPDWRETFPATNVLRLPSASDYQPSEDWLRATLGEEAYGGGVVMVASLSEENLVRVLEQIGDHLRPLSLRGVRVYVVAAPVHWRRIERALAASGAEFVPLDPSVAIPQRPERLRD
jgi:hypothetical protein